MVSFGEAIRLFKDRYTDFSGRSTRAEYWWVQLALILFFLVIGFLFGIIGGVNVETGAMGIGGYVIGGLALIIFLAIIIPLIALILRRFHDVGLSGWVYLGLIVASLIPIIGFIASIATLVITVLPSKPEINKWGPPRNGEAIADTFS